VLVEFEFDTREEKAAFKMPWFCLADVTKEDFVAGAALLRQELPGNRTSSQEIQLYEDYPEGITQ